ncbi:MULTISPECIES: subtype B tannase [unclassified Streptomyces]|uniref:subtype B tannase n=1 Tax=unclassified Streptomyces TaxID=2593676 RepID=UPI00278BF5CB|nr:MULTISPECIES: subtype B tannase [unclassified Streptomyces]
MKHRAINRAIKRRNVVIGIGATAGAVAAGGLTLSARASTGSTPDGPSGALTFDKEAYTELTTTVTTDDGDKEVTYHFWKAITYVAEPVDEKYQSLNVSVPVEIDGKAVDASGAPILLANSIGGYMPSSVADADGVGGGGGGMPGGGDGPPGGGGGPLVSNQLLALAAGYVVVEPGARGRTLKDDDGTYYGTAPAAIVDLKAAVRYVRANKGRIPGDTDRIVSAGTSAGGALSALLGASGDSRSYAAHLAELGAADASDAIFATGAWCPITDLEHADGAYEWNWGTNKQNDGTQVDQATSKQLRAQFAEYQAALRLRRMDGRGTLTARNYDDYLLTHYLQPSATRYLAALPEGERATYLADNTFITWRGGRATFTWQDFLTHVGARKKDTPAFDPFDLSSPENNEFGAGTTEARHFTAYGARHDTSGLDSRRVAPDIPEKLDLMNPMHHLARRNPGRSKHWWIRLGTKDSDTSLTVSANLAASAAGLGDEVDHRYYWDAGHGANTDPADFIAWIAEVTGYRKK